MDVAARGVQKLWGTPQKNCPPNIPPRTKFRKSLREISSWGPPPFGKKFCSNYLDILRLVNVSKKHQPFQMGRQTYTRNRSPRFQFLPHPGGGSESLILIQWEPCRIEKARVFECFFGVGKLSPLNKMSNNVQRMSTRIFRGTILPNTNRIAQFAT